MIWVRSRLAAGLRPHRRGAVLLAAACLLAAPAGCTRPASESTPPAARSTQAASPGAAPHAPLSGPSSAAPVGPAPRAELDHNEYDFGIMELGEKNSHVFTLRNAGDAPLEVKLIRSTCQCTISKAASQKVEPGGSTEVELTWEPEAAKEEFRVAAILETNDLARPQITAQITGRVVYPLIVTPETEWTARDLEPGQTAVLEGTIHSLTRDRFEITSVAFSRAEAAAGSPPRSAAPAIADEPTPDGSPAEDPHAEAAPAPPRYELKPLAPEKQAELGAKSGYAVRVAYDVGQEPDFVYRMTFVSDVRPLPFEVALRGVRKSLVTAIGPAWNAQENFVNLKTFSRSKGAHGEFFLRLDEADAPVEFEIVELDPPCLKVAVEPQGEPSNRRQTFRVTVEIPPQPQSSFRDRDHPGWIRLKTTHARLPRMRLQVRYSAQ